VTRIGRAVTDSQQAVKHFKGLKPFSNTPASTRVFEKSPRRGS